MERIRLKMADGAYLRALAQARFLMFAAGILAAIIMLSGCTIDGRSSQTPTPEIEPTPLATATPTPEPTATPEPTSTPEPTPEPTATPTPSPTPEPTPEPGPDLSEAPFPLDCDDLEMEHDAELQEVVDSRVGEFADGFGIVVYELTTGAYAEVNSEQSFYAASLYKTAVMYELLRQVDDGQRSLDDYVVIDSYYASQDLGTLGVFGWGVGSTITVREALEASIVISDNSTAFLLGDLVNWPRIDDTLQELGAIDTQYSLDTLPTTAADNSRIMEAIACGIDVEPESSQLMLDILNNQTIDNRLPLYLPEDAVIGHKTGNWSDANHDVGIVYGPNAVYLITVMSIYPGADERMALLSRDVYEYFHPEAYKEDHLDELRPR